MKKTVWGALLAAGFALSAQGGAAADTLSTVKERGKVNCGVSRALRAFRRRTIRANGPASTLISAVRFRLRSLAIPTR